MRVWKQCEDDKQAHSKPPPASHDGRNHRYPAAFNLFTNSLTSLGSLQSSCFVKRGQFGDISSRTKGSFTCPGENYGPHSAVTLDLFERITQIEQHLARERIELLGAVEANDCERITTLAEEGRA